MLRAEGGALVLPAPAGSPLLDRTDDARSLAADQRGTARSQDGDGNGAARYDISTVEGDSTALPPPAIHLKLLDREPCCRL